MKKLSLNELKKLFSFLSRENEYNLFVIEGGIGSRVKNRFFKPFLLGAAALPMIMGGASCVPSQDTKPPKIYVNDQYGTEGQEGTFSVCVTDESGIANFRVDIFGFNITASGPLADNSIKVEYSPYDPNQAGDFEIRVEATDKRGNLASKQATLHIADTPDVEFYNMPSKITVQEDKTATATGYITDDYSSLEALVLNAQAEHATASIEKKAGEEFEIQVTPETGYIGNTFVHLEAQDEEGNSSSYSIPVEVVPLEKIAVQLSISGVNVSDTDNDGLIDNWTDNVDSGNVMVSVYKLPITSIDQEKKWIYVDKDAAQLAMPETEFSNENISFELEKGSSNDFLYKVVIRDKDESHGGVSYLINPEQDTTKNLELPQDNNKLILVLAALFNNETYSQERPQNTGDVAIENSSAKHTFEIGESTLADWTAYILREDTPSSEMKINETISILNMYFPGINIEIVDEFPDFQTNEIFIRYDAMTGYFGVAYKEDTNITRGGVIGLSEGEVSDGTLQRIWHEETASLRFCAAEIPDHVDYEESVFTDGQERTDGLGALDYAGIEIRKLLPPGATIHITGEPENDLDASLHSNAITLNNSIYYVLPPDR